MSPEAWEYAKRSLEKMENIAIALFICVLMCVGLITALAFQLKQAHNNERELSRRLYHAVKAGYPDYEIKP